MLLCFQKQVTTRENDADLLPCRRCPRPLPGFIYGRGGCGRHPRAAQRLQVGIDSSQAVIPCGEAHNPE